MASAHRDGSVRLWNVASGQCSSVLGGHDDDIDEISYSADGTRIWTASKDWTARAWNVKTGECLCQFETGSATPPCFSPGGAFLVTKRPAGEGFDVWDTPEQKLAWSVVDAIANSEKATLSISPDGRLVAIVASATKFYSDLDRKVSVRLWDLATGEMVAKMENSRRLVESLAWDLVPTTADPLAEELYLIFGHYDGEVSLWNVDTKSGKEKDAVSSPSTPVQPQKNEGRWSQLTLRPLVSRQSMSW